MYCKVTDASDSAVAGRFTAGSSSSNQLLLALDQAMADLDAEPPKPPSRSNFNRNIEADSIGHLAVDAASIDVDEKRLNLVFGRSPPGRDFLAPYSAGFYIDSYGGFTSCLSVRASRSVEVR
jgi:hypothetical protein